MINRAQNHVGFSWKDAEVLRDGICVLQMLDEMKRWAPVYWGPRKELRIAGLAPCTCYDFRIKPEDGQDWIRFKGATLDGPYLAMHMTRAIKFGKTPLIRKIAHARYNMSCCWQTTDEHTFQVSVARSREQRHEDASGTSHRQERPRAGQSLDHSRCQRQYCVSLHQENSSDGCCRSRTPICR